MHTASFLSFFSIFFFHACFLNSLLNLVKLNRVTRYTDDLYASLLVHGFDWWVANLSTASHGRYQVRHSIPQPSFSFQLTILRISLKLATSLLKPGLRVFSIPFVNMANGGKVTCYSIPIVLHATSATSLSKVDGNTCSRLRLGDASKLEPWCLFVGPSYPF